MRLRVLGGSGGQSLRHGNPSFLLNDRVAMDAGNVAGTLTVEEQGELDTILVTHAHMDHVTDLGNLTDFRFQQEGPALVVAGTRDTIDALRTHFFNDVLWPDFTQIPPGGPPTLVFEEFELEQPFEVNGLTVTPIGVDHSVPTCGFLVDDGTVSICYTGDTGPTDRIWKVLSGVPNLRAVITEVSYPNRMHDLSLIAGHLTPNTFAEQVAKLERTVDLPLYIYGLKPVYEAETRGELEELRSRTGLGFELVESGKTYEF